MISAAGAQLTPRGKRAPAAEITTHYQEAAKFKQPFKKVSLQNMNGQFKSLHLQLSKIILTIEI